MYSVLKSSGSGKLNLKTITIDILRTDYVIRRGPSVSGLQKLTRRFETPKVLLKNHVGKRWGLLSAKHEVGVVWRTPRCE